jgi:hypothetical protein
VIWKKLTHYRVVFEKSFFPSKNVIYFKFFVFSGTGPWSVLSGKLRPWRKKPLKDKEIEVDIETKMKIILSKTTASLVSTSKPVTCAVAI